MAQENWISGQEHKGRTLYLSYFIFPQWGTISSDRLKACLMKLLLIVDKWEKEKKERRENSKTLFDKYCSLGLVEKLSNTHSLTELLMGKYKITGII